MSIGRKDWLIAGKTSGTVVFRIGCQFTTAPETPRLESRSMQMNPQWKLQSTT